MAKSHSKRLREESLDDYSSFELEDTNQSQKRQRPYTNILNILDEEDEDGPPESIYEPSQDFSAILTTLQQELCDSVAEFDVDSQPSTAEAELSSQDAAAATATADSADEANDEEGLKSVMRHLLEASDDELGIPNRGDDENNIIELNSVENFPFALTDHGLWEIDDDVANYYTFLQSEYFM